MRGGKPHVRENAHRTVTAYLYLPMSIDGCWRWLEYATWEERYTWTVLGLRWVPILWVEEGEQS